MRHWTSLWNGLGNVKSEMLSSLWLCKLLYDWNWNLTVVVVFLAAIILLTISRNLVNWNSLSVIITRTIATMHGQSFPNQAPLYCGPSSRPANIEIPFTLLTIISFHTVFKSVEVWRDGCLRMIIQFNFTELKRLWLRFDLAVISVKKLWCTTEFFTACQTTTI